MYIFAVYTGSAIYTSSEGGVMKDFGVNPTDAFLPLSLYVLAQRAQRFRIRAACIAWCKREGTGAKNATILGMIPKECIAANSTKVFRDLTRAEVDLVEKKNSGTVRRKNQNMRGDVSEKREGTGVKNERNRQQACSQAQEQGIHSPRQGQRQTFYFRQRVSERFSDRRTSS